jgi:uncharacterized membrane protein YidH (DUF202 family)
MEQTQTPNTVNVKFKSLLLDCTLICHDTLQLKLCLVKWKGAEKKKERNGKEYTIFPIVLIFLIFILITFYRHINASYLIFFSSIFPCLIAF